MFLIINKIVFAKPWKGCGNPVKSILKRVRANFISPTRVGLGKVLSLCDYFYWPAKNKPELIQYAATGSQPKPRRLRTANMSGLRIHNHEYR
jgi:hypothetical protein